MTFPLFSIIGIFSTSVTFSKTEGTNTENLPVDDRKSPAGIALLASPMAFINLLEKHHNFQVWFYRLWPLISHLELLLNAPLKHLEWSLQFGSSLAKAKSSLWFDELEIKFISNIGYSSKVNSFTTGSSDSEGNSCLAFVDKIFYILHSFIF